MTGMRVEVREVECPGCGALLDLGAAADHPSEAALMAYVEGKVDEHIAACAPARERLAAAAQGEAST